MSFAASAKTLGQFPQSGHSPRNGENQPANDWIANFPDLRCNWRNWRERRSPDLLCGGKLSGSIFAKQPFDRRGLKLPVNDGNEPLVGFSVPNPDVDFVTSFDI